MYILQVLQSKTLFTQEIKETVDKLPSALTFSTELNDFIMQFLTLNPNDRPICRTICMHPWLEGAFHTILSPKHRTRDNKTPRNLTPKGT
jgi:serine/threonine protein kinase